MNTFARMTEEQVALVRRSWDALQTRKAEFAEASYEELFRIQPQVRALFEGLITDQHRKLTETIDRAVSALHTPDQLAPALRDLGQRHLAYGVKDHHHVAVSTAMFTILRKMLGEDFTPTVQEAWAEFYAFLQKGMQQR